jgi:soluble P-type ATPase
MHFDETLREDAADAVRALRAEGVSISLLSGDEPQRVARLAERLGIEHWVAAATPERKLEALREAQSGDRAVAMVGDGVNDAPVLAQADVSFAMAQGAQIARHAADAVLLGGRVGDVAHALRLARRTRRVMKLNLAWAALYNAACVPLALVGWLPPWAAGLGMALSSLVVVGHSMRLARVPTAMKAVGHRRHAGGRDHRRPAGLARTELRHPWLSYGRLRPLHTNAVIFAFGGCVLFATSYHVVQRTCQTRLFLPGLAMFTFWGWNLVIVLAVITLPLGMTQGKEYAELEWPIDLLIAVVWVAYAIVFFGTVGTRKVAHLRGQLVLRRLHHRRGAAAHRQQRGHSGQPDQELLAYAGVQDAMVQWWYGHNAVGFFLTAGFLGMMYYYIPKQAGRPVYSYRLSIVHFWALIFTYMWAGPHHLHYTALPDWAQSVGMIFSLVLLAPSWGGMINGIMTLSGAWHKLRDDPILKFLIVSLSFYGMSTFEGPMMSIKTVNALSHYTDWTVGHVHSGALGWVGLIRWARCTT